MVRADVMAAVMAAVGRAEVWVGVGRAEVVRAEVVRAEVWGVARVEVRAVAARVAAMGGAETVVDWEEVVRAGVTVVGLREVAKAVVERMAGVREVAKAAVVRAVGAMVVEARAPVALAISYPRH